MLLATFLSGCLLVPALVAEAGVSSVSCGPAEPQSQRSPQACETERAFRADVELLTSPRAGGRAPGTDGERLVLRHLVARMRDAGLQPTPGLAHDGWVQEFLVPDPRPRRYLPAGTSCEVLGGARQRVLALGTEVEPHGGSADGDVTAEVVFAGHGLVIPAIDHDDYRGLDVRGKVVLVLRGAPRGEDGPGAARHREARMFAAKLANAQRAGAAGMLLCNRADARAVGGGGDGLEMAGRASGDAAFPTLWIARACADELLRGGEHAPGLTDRQARVDGGDTSVLGPLPGVRVRIRTEMGPRREKLESANVIGVLPGTDPVLAQQYVVVGAHYDHLGLGENGSLGGRSAVGKLHPGADDNASGVAGMLALARVLADATPLRRSVAFVAFGAEELWLRGSAAFLERGPIPRERVVAMLNLNMIGRGASGSFRIEGVASGHGLEALVRGAATWDGKPAPVRATASCRSDHQTFLAAGIPALLLHTGLHDQFHTPADVMALVEVPQALQVVTVAADVVRALDAQDRAPAFAGNARRISGSGR